MSDFKHDRDCLCRLNNSRDSVPEGYAYCCHCQRLGDVKQRSSLGMGIFLYKGPNGENLWRWLCRSECQAAWEKRYGAFMEQHAPEIHGWWQDRERQDEYRKKRRAA